LGRIFHQQLTFWPLKYLKAKCEKALDILGLLANTDWGSNRETLLLLYRSLICFNLDYGRIVYGSACRSYLRMLDPIHNQELRLSEGIQSVVC